MEERNEKKNKGPYRKKGCLISILIALGLIVFIIWQIGEPGRRAKRVHQAIRPGMSFERVENLLTGRYYRFFQVNTNGQWQSLSRDEFIGFVAATTTSAPGALRLQLHFMGIAPNRVSFFVELDSSGNATNITNPYGWD